MRIRSLLLLLVLPPVCLAAAPSVSRATTFRLPLSDCDTATKCRDSNKCYATAYFDHNGQDWSCGDEAYDGHVGSDFGVGGVVGVRPVVAGAAGTVTQTNDGCGSGYWGSTCGGGFGNFVKLQHADGKVTIYGHMLAGSLKVQQGATVTCGQELGRVGNSGNSTGPHLHFEVVDPTYGSDDPFAGSCGGPLSYWVSQGNYCQLPSATCEGTCVRQCGGKECGPDGCGSTCGTCQSSETCFGDGVCGITSLDDAIFVSETIPDGTHFKPGEAFTKTWTLRNVGSTAWTRAAGFSLAFQSGDSFGALARTWPGPTESIAPAATKAWSVPMTAPLAPGTYRGYWQMDRNGVAFGATVWLEIVVDAADVDDARLTGETVPDDTRFVSGSSFTKTWTLRNAGTSSWTRAGGYQWKYLRGDLMGATATVDLGASETIGPSGSRVWSVPMQAPSTPGTYRGYWQMSHNGVGFGEEIWVQIIATAPVVTDQDGDGHHAPASGGDDCNDADPDVFPGNTEKCEGKDNDCDGATDEGLTRDCFWQACKGTESCANGSWFGCNAPEPKAEA
ncbi:MAG: peptidoglycan DD-metalloendopeptidase family protein, partial [Deltaproteobacteria bacterium]|nr:peptidoglycan DD-metalloendopeptidase family protein [Deltaproteobacteria bacterium]